MEFLGIKKGIEDEQIIYINFESLDYSFIKNAKDLNDYIKSLVKNKKKEDSISVKDILLEKKLKIYKTY